MSKYGARKLALVCMLPPLATAAAADDSYPTKAVRLIVPFAAGGASSVIGSLTRTSYDAIKDFAPVTLLTRSPYVLVVHPSLPVKTLNEFLALAKSRPGALDYASSGSANHIATELFAMIGKIKMHHIPYKGGGPAITDLLGGHVQVHITTAVNMIPLINSGQLKGLALSSDKRLPALPQLPTFAQAGMPTFTSQNWNGILVPATTPRALVNRLAADFGKVLRMPDVGAKLEAQGNFPAPTTPEEFAALIKSEIDRFAEVVKSANIPQH